MLEIRGKEFFLEDKKINIYSGVMHYFRIMPDYWEDRLLKLKLAGFNTVETYVCWNLHEPRKGEFDFSGILDIERYVATAAKVGLMAIVRPGPYICAEWDNGGLPAWLLKDRNMRLRCYDETYLGHVKDFYQELLSRLDKHTLSQGGNIIAMQVENEYGSFGNDKRYLKAIEDIMLEGGVKELLFTSDGNDNYFLSGGTLPHLYKVLNFGSGAANAFKCLDKIQPDAPKMCGEFWCGWFDHWGEKHHMRSSTTVAGEIKAFLKQDANFNVYMFHGGTNFNCWAGANYHGFYAPTTTSYDYCAFLNEYGDYTPAYHAVRDVLLEAQGLEKLPLPESPKLQNIGGVELTHEASLMENIKVLGQQHKSTTPECMEHYGQNFGMILYSTVINGDYPMRFLNIEEVHDVAYLYIDGVLKKTYYRGDNKKSKNVDGFSILLPSFKGECKVEILVEAMGRVNYGKRFIDRKGIGRVMLDAQIIYDWDVYTLPLDNLEVLQFGVQNSTMDCPKILKGKFKASSQADTFVDMAGFTKGMVYVNGFNLGKYWRVGPQRTLYVPGVLLKEENEIMILEQEKYKSASVSITDKHILNKKF